MGRRIRITNEIRTAISRAIEAAGSQSELSRLSGVPQKNLSNYISSANSLMNEATWMQLTPFLRDYLPNIKIRFVNVVDLFKLESHEKHPHGLTDAEYDAIFTKDKPIVMAYHGYTKLIHELTYTRHNKNLQVFG